MTRRNVVCESDLLGRLFDVPVSVDSRMLIRAECYWCGKIVHKVRVCFSVGNRRERYKIDTEFEIQGR